MLRGEANRVYESQILMAGSTATSLAAFGRDSTENTYVLKMVKAKLEKLEQRLQDHREYLEYHESTHEWGIEKVYFYCRFSFLANS